MRFTDEEVGVRKKAVPYGPACYIPTFEAISDHEKQPLGVSTLHEFFMKS